MLITATLTFFLMLSLNLLCMEDTPIEGKPRSHSITITIQDQTDTVYAQNPIAYQMVKLALNGETDRHVVELIGRFMDNNRNGVLYRDLKAERTILGQINDDKSQEARDNLVRYIIHEMTDNLHQESINSKHQQRQKYIIALIGAGSTIVTSVITAVLMYFSSFSSHSS